MNKLSDYTFGMPFITGISITPQIKHIENFSKQETVTASSESVFNAVTQELTETYGRGEINVKVFGDNDIENEFGDRSEEEKQDMKTSDGFILNGTIYINGSRHNLEAPFHEMMHLAAAVMKFSPDKEIREMYYK
jgi:sugar-specific transcriptional regulator TrmB